MSIFELLPDEASLRPEGQYTVFHPSEVELADTTKAVLDKVEEIGARRIVIDSLSELRMLASDPFGIGVRYLLSNSILPDEAAVCLMLDDRVEANEIFSFIVLRMA